MINILIVEDEARIARFIGKLTREYMGDRLGDMILLSERSEAAAALEDNRFDLLLLDLNLNGQDGFELLNRAVAGAFHTIVISAYRDRAVDAFEYGVLDFVPKPFNSARLGKAFDRFFDTHQHSNKETRYLAVKQHGKIRLIPIAEVQYIRGAGHYTTVHLRDGSECLHDKSMDRLLVLLPPAFERVHKSYIANLNQAIEIITTPGSIYELRLSCNSLLPIGRTRYKKLKERLQMGTSN